MFSTPEPFLTAEINYRQSKVTEDYHRHARRRHRVQRRRSLKIPKQRVGTEVVT